MLLDNAVNASTPKALRRTRRRAMSPLFASATIPRLAVLGFVMGALVFFTSCSSGGSSNPAAASQSPSAATVQGTFVLNGDALWTNLPTDGPEPAGIMWSNPVDGAACQGKGGYSDIAPGLQVLLKDGSTVLDVATFGQGAFTDTVASPTHYTTPEGCTFTFTLHVPAGHQFYTVSVGTRGDRTYTYSQITSSGALSYQLGNS